MLLFVTDFVPVETHCVWFIGAGDIVHLFDLNLYRHRRIAQGFIVIFPCIAGVCADGFHCAEIDRQTAAVQRIAPTSILLGIDPALHNIENFLFAGVFDGAVGGKYKGKILAAFERGFARPVSRAATGRSKPFADYTAARTAATVSSRAVVCLSGRGAGFSNFHQGAHKHLFVRGKKAEHGSIVFAETEQFDNALGSCRCKCPAFFTEIRLKFGLYGLSL